MKQTSAVAFMAVLAFAQSPCTPHARAGPPDTHSADAVSADAVAAGLRTPWTTSRITGSPDPPLPYEVERVFPSLTFNNSVDMTNAPGSERLFVVEVGGKIFSFPAREDVSAPDLFLDVAQQVEGVQQVYALTFHPNFEQNRYCYICYIMAAGLDDGTRVARLRVTNTDPPQVEPDSETVLIEWLSGGHNGCCLKFGPDGYLYISTGDAAAANPPDSLQTGQDISDLLSSILRIDVDHADGRMNYRVPEDNPFVATAGARGEVWAYGFRNPWRMSFDRKTGDLWVGDVGWELWELLFRVERGGNYGWAVKEGRQPTNPEWPRGPTAILPPTVDHPHSEAASITGGLTYYGSRLNDLQGTYVYGDYETGKVWGLRYENGTVGDGTVGNGAVEQHRELVDTTLRIVCFAEDNDGELFILDHTGGTIHRLVPNPDAIDRGTFPTQLSETGLFTSTAQLVPAAGVIPYSINAEPWADHAAAERLVALPGDSQIAVEGEAWKFPKDAVLAKTISLETEFGVPESRRRLETQILHFTGNDWRGYTYIWNDAQTDAALLDAAGLDRSVDIIDPAAPAGRRKQTWHFPARAECMRCHNPWAGTALAFNTAQLNNTHNDSTSTINQLDRLAQIGLIAQPISAEKRPRLADPHDASADRNDRARAYLHTNCAHCHRMHAGSAVLSKMRHDLELEETTMVGVRPTQGAFGIHTAHVISPGDPFRSVLLYRMLKLGSARMPHIGSTEVDLDGVELIRDWIRDMPNDGIDQSAGNQATASLRAAETSLLDRLRSATDAAVEDQSELVESLLSSTSGALALVSAMRENVLAASTRAVVIQQATGHEDVRVRDLFERFLPEEQRTKRLGSVIDAEEILALAGDPSRGKRAFFETAGVQCKSCHRVGEVGVEMGPDLDEIGKKYRRTELLDAILQPSASIEPKYVMYLAETSEGLLHTGLLVSKSGDEVVLKDIQNELIRISADQIEQLVPQQQSMMPELLLRDMTAQQVADLLAYLELLK